jgi:ATP-binding cassette subfamily B protein
MSQTGKNFSGGQKQRLAIARALVKKPEIYVFDDAFSALDYKTDIRLRNRLKSYTNSATVIIVAQRVSTIIDADHIVVLHEGEIVGQGKHQDLLTSCSIYKEIVYSQLDPEEVEKTLALTQNDMKTEGSQT